jgi:hypothetical protein
MKWICAVNIENGVVTKQGSQLKEGDQIILGHDSTPWIVKRVEYDTGLSKEELVEGECYDVVNPRDQRVSRFRLAKKEMSFGLIFLTAEQSNDQHIVAPIGKLPTLFKGGEGRLVPSGFSIESMDGKDSKILSFDEASTMRIALHIPDTHVLLASGKPHGSPDHFTVTTEEPYAVCCVEGLKISLGMHRFGNSRFGQGIADDFRSVGDQNTRIVGGKPSATKPLCELCRTSRFSPRSLYQTLRNRWISTELSKKSSTS